MRIIGAVDHRSSQVRVRILDRRPPARSRREDRLNGVARFLAVADQKKCEPGQRIRERAVDLSIFAGSLDTSFT